MTKTLTDIAKSLSTPEAQKKIVTKETKPIEPREVTVNKPVPKVQLIYAFNGTGKTRLSREVKNLVSPKGNGNGNEGEISTTRTKFLYFSAFTEDLFYWDNDLSGDSKRKLIIQPNNFTDWLISILKAQGQDANIVKYFQQYTDDKLTPHINEDFSEVSFSFERGNEEKSENIKISKGEESNFIWSVFYSLLSLAISERNIPESEDRSTNDFDQLEYVFIDDPVSSLDENHLIQLAVNLAQLIKSSDYTHGSGLKFIVTTHSPLFYNVLYNELGMNKGNKKEGCYLLEKFDDGTYDLNVKFGDSNKSFSYHLHIKSLIKAATEQGNVQRYHFALLRNLYEKTANFLGYKQWSDLLPEDNQLAYANRIMNLYPHNTLSNEEIAEPTTPEKQMVRLLLDNLDNYGYWKQDE